MIHRMGCTVIFKGRGESLQGVDPSMTHHQGCTLFYRGGGGYIGYIRKALKTGDLEHPGLHAVLTIYLRSLKCTNF